MQHLTRRGFVAAGLGAGAAAYARLATRADTVLYNGRILTQGAAREVEALALAGAYVFASGTSAEMRALLGRNGRHVDLGGRRVTPGFNDAHAHPGNSGVELVTKLPLEMSSIDGIVAAIRQRAATLPPDAWVVGFLYDDTKTPRPLDRADLDAAAPAHPVVVQHRGGHTAFVNSRALALARVDEQTPKPAHGEYFRDAAGRLNGRVAEQPAEAILALAGKPPTRDDYRRGAALITHELARRGVTSVTEADGAPLELQGFQDARDADELSARVYFFVGYRHLDTFTAAGVHTGFGDEWLRVGGVKLYADGSISERTALMSTPYEGLGDYRGLGRATREELYAAARQARLAGWQVGTHANGDVAIDTVLGIYEQLQREAPRRDPRWRIEHCTLVNAGLIGRIQALGAIPVPFAGYVYFHAEKMHFYGDERLRHMFAMREFLDAGIPAPSSSDYTASPSDPALWLRSQVTRTGPDGHVWGANQRITVVEAIRCGTVHGAHASFEDGVKGRLEPGQLADLVVWDRDLLAIDPLSLIEARVERTMVGGRWRYEA